MGDVAALEFTCVWQEGECLNSNETSKTSSQGNRYIKLKVSSDCQPPSSLSSPTWISVTAVTHWTQKSVRFWRNKYFYNVFLKNFAFDVTGSECWELRHDTVLSTKYGPFLHWDRFACSFTPRMNLVHNNIEVSEAMHKRTFLYTSVTCALLSSPSFLLTLTLDFP